MRRKDVQRLALELVDAIEALRTEMAMQDATIQRQAAEIDRLKGDRPEPIGTFLFSEFGAKPFGSVTLQPSGEIDGKRLWDMFGKHVVVTLEPRL